MKTATIIDVLAAAHWTYKLSGVPSEFSQRGGIMLVGPPEQLKTQFVSMLEDYPRTLILSDLTTRELADYSMELGQSYKTLGFTAFEKISQRDADIASNLIGNLTALAEEGYRGSYKLDRRQRTYKSRCLLIGAVPQSFYDYHYKDWLASGFIRRFLWPSFHLSDPDVIKHAIIRWKPLNLRDGSVGFPIPSDSIPYGVTADQRTVLSKFLRQGEGISSPLILLSKIFSVLAWRYSYMPNAEEIALSILRDFSESLQRIADLEIGAVPEVEESVRQHKTNLKNERKEHGKSKAKRRKAASR